MTGKACVLIPARFSSTRFPGKPLAIIEGKPMIQRVASIATEAVGRDNVYVCTDDRRIKNLVEAVGFNCIFDFSEAETGTDRIAAASKNLDYEIFVNLQGDEPLADPEDILRAIKLKELNPNKVINSYIKLDKNEDPNNVNLPKVVLNKNGDLVYMSRAAVPASKNNLDVNLHNFLKQVCIYAFNKRDLDSFKNFGRTSQMEISEDIEILRFLALGTPVLMFESTKQTIAVDVPGDIEKVERYLRDG